MCAMTSTKEVTSDSADHNRLDPDQKAAAKSLISGRNVLIEAPPGTGKTFLGVALGIVAVRKSLLPQNAKVLFLTFSKNARVQIERQADELVSNGTISRLERKRLEISNYHSFFFDCLEQRKGLWGISTPLRVCSLTKRSRVFANLLKASTEAGDSDLLSHSLALCRFEAEQLFGTSAQRCPSLLVNQASKMITSSIREGRPHYDDFGPLMLDLVESSPSLLAYLRASFPIVVLDEFQDTDLLQWEILKRWRPPRLVVLYDGFQMIYEWRGSTQERITQLKSEFDPFEPHSLQTNHRTGQDERGLADFLMALRRDNLKGVEAKESPKDELRNWLRLRAIRGTVDARIASRCALPIAAQIKRCLEKGESVAVITRGNSLAKQLYQVLSTRPKVGAMQRPSFACRILGSNDNCDEILREWIDELRSVDSVADLAEWLGEGLDVLLGGERRIQVERSGRRQKITFKKLFKAVSQPRFKSLNDLLPIGRKDEKFWSGCEPTLINLAKGQGKIDFGGLGERLDSLLLLTTKFSQYYAVFCDPDAVYLMRAIVRASKNSSDIIDRDERADRMESALRQATFLALRRSSTLPTFMCAHQSKGREFDHVIIPWLAGVAEDATKDYSGNNQFCKVSGDPIRDNEELRLFYVALSRAKKKVTVFFPEESPSGIIEKWGLNRATL